MHWVTFKKLQKVSFKNSFVCKRFFGEKRCGPFPK